ncbi:predicted protein [Postia placenta Mad-698-R]|uniref:Uncharacterized protein n=1 Tax=Postia placenta MAD-698-R-SB12 TaxID=670580 RepID=A0A1X6NCZ6_9APHY|nr:hypothetical protein POSPLADRAFT_1130872 [Postia placenta MAD-698-R-SB12]EED81687.1 predicted protein [Postia placenta Mad-698-R]OSX66498.1 hypothetical protein POSPLADRAFT_1130872 [Postia placenta MAD-698-R-SB12]
MVDEEEAVADSPPKACGPVRLPATATRVVDADEEIFLLYTSLAARGPCNGLTGFRGLGHIDSHHDTLTIEFTLDEPHDSTAQGPTQSSTRQNSKKLARQEQTLTVELFQDKTALRSRKGDTGSVLWHARHAAQLLSDARAGTGLLSIVLSPLVMRYTATDIEDLIPLIRKNLAHNSPRNPPAAKTSQKTKYARGRIVDHTPNVIAEALDWVVLHNASPSIRRSLCSFAPVNLLLVVDCIYHPSLLPALLSTIDCLAVPRDTTVLVIVELRAEDVVREFLDRWLSLSSATGGQWEIWSLRDVLDGPYAAWVGWKR